MDFGIVLIVLIIFLAVFVIGLIALSIWKPFIGRLIARIYAVLSLGAGVAGVVTGTYFINYGSDVDEWQKIGPLSAGAGLLVSGIVVLVLSLADQRKKTDDDRAA